MKPTDEVILSEATCFEDREEAEDYAEMINFDNRDEECTVTSVPEKQ